MAIAARSVCFSNDVLYNSKIPVESNAFNIVI